MELQFEDNEYYLVDENNDTIATTDRILIKEDGYMKKLSIKNCEEIQRGYDVFELAYDSSKEFLMESTHSPSFTFGYEQGFQKALEILGDKKYTDDDIVDAYMAGHIRGMSTDMGEDNIHPICSEYLNSLQKTEWDVEVEQELIQSSIQGDAIWELKKDTDGCLILRRI